MLDLREIRIGVAVVHQRVEIVGSFPNAFFASIQLQVLIALFAHEIQGLMRVVLPVKFRHAGIGIGGVVAKLVRRLAFLITGTNEVIPFFNIRHWILRIRHWKLTGGHK